MTVVTGNGAVVAFSATVTLGGTVASAGFELDKVTVAPPAGAGDANVTVPVDELPPVTLEGLSESVKAAGVTATVPESVDVRLALVTWMAAVPTWWPVNVALPAAPPMRPIFLLMLSTNQSLPSEPAAICPGPLFVMGNSVMTPVGVILPIWAREYSVNQRLPSGPAAISPGPLPVVGRGNSVMTPAGVIRPILLPPFSANQMFPSGPAAIPCGWLLPEIWNSVITPAGVIRPIWLAMFSVNHRLPSRPAAMR